MMLCAAAGRAPQPASNGRAASKQIVAGRNTGCQIASTLFIALQALFRR
jgi:hypothetical protein